MVAKFGHLEWWQGKQNGTLGSSRGALEGPLGHLGAAMGAKVLQRGPLGHPGDPWETMRAPGVGHRVPREARSVAKERQRGAKGCQRRTKRGPGWAKGCQDCRSRAPKWCQNGSKMNLAMVKVPILKMSKNHWFFHSKWPRSQSRTSQNAPQGPNDRAPWQGRGC